MFKNVILDQFGPKLAKYEPGANALLTGAG